MTERDRTAIHVDFVAIQEPVLLHARLLSGERLVTSTRSMSSSLSPAFFSAMRVAGTGPEPMILGSTPAKYPSSQCDHRLQVALFGSSSGITTVAAAHPRCPLALPAVTVPVLPKAGFSLRRLSIVSRDADDRSSVNISPVGSPRRLRQGHRRQSSCRRPAL